MIIVEASNLLDGGGLILLRELAQILADSKVDHRIISRTVLSRYFNPGVWIANDQFPFGRYERIMSVVNTNPNCSVLLFGNLPLARRIPTTPQVVYFHNLNIIHRPDSKTYDLETRLKNLILFRYAKTFSRDTVMLVQTELVRQAVSEAFSVPNDQIRIMPFFKPLSASVVNPASGKPTLIYDFIYPAVYHTHKNFTRLFSAIEYAYMKLDVRATYLILSNENPELRQSVDRLRGAGVSISYQSDCGHANTMQHLSASKYLLYPSLNESLGLPLIEAGQLSTQVIASDLPYVHQVIVPSLTFDPKDVASIANAISRAMTALLPPTRLKIRSHARELVDMLRYAALHQELPPIEAL